jgi:hypothetical protein
VSSCIVYPHVFEKKNVFLFSCVCMSLVIIILFCSHIYKQHHFHPLKEALALAKEKRLTELRNWRAGHWAKASVKALEESEALIEAATQDRLRRERELIAFDDAE